MATVRCLSSAVMSACPGQSDTTRTLLNRMEKRRLVSSANPWLAMRNVCDRLVHDYLPEQVTQMFEEISGDYGDEPLHLGEKLH